MAALIVEARKGYLENELGNFLVATASCEQIYSMPITFYGKQWCIARIELVQTTLNTGNHVPVVFETGMPTFMRQEVLVSFGLLVSLVERDALLAGDVSPTKLPLVITIALEARVSDDGSTAAILGHFHGVVPKTWAGVDLQALFATRLPEVSVPLPLVRLTDMPLSLRGAGLKLLVDGTVVLRVTIDEQSTGRNPKTDRRGFEVLASWAQWSAFWSQYDTAKHLAPGDDWAILLEKELLEFAVVEEFKRRLPAMQSKGFQPDGLPSVAWRPDLKGLRIDGEGEVEVPVCSDFNVWYEAVVTFELKPPPVLETTTCTDGGLTASGKAEVAFCVIGAAVVAGILGNALFAPVTEVLGPIGVLAISIFAASELSEQISSQAQNCTTRRSTLAFAGSTAKRLAYDPLGLVFAGTSNRAFLGNPEMQTDGPAIDAAGWVLPVCALQEDYAPWTIRNCGSVPLEICRFESVPAFEVTVEGYIYRSGDSAGIVIGPGEQKEIRAKGAGRLIVYTNAGVRSVAIAPPPASIPIPVERGGGPDSLELRPSFEARQAPLAWLCSNLRHFERFVRLPLWKGGHAPIDRIFPPLPLVPGAVAVFDVLLTNTTEGSRLAAAVRDGAGEREVAAVVASGGFARLDLAALADGELWLAVDLGDSPGGEAGPGLRLTRFTILPVGRLVLPTTVQAQLRLGQRLYLVGDDALWGAALRTPDGQIGAPVRLLDLEPGGVSCLAGSGHLLFHARGTELSILDVSGAAPRRLARVRLQGEVRQLTLRRRRAYLATNRGVEILEAADPSEPRNAGVLPVRNARGLGFLGSTGYVVGDRGLQVIERRGDTDLLAAHLPMRGPFVGLSVRGRTLHLHQEGGGCQIVSCDDPAQPRHVGAYTGPHWMRGTVLEGGFALRLEAGEVVVQQILCEVPDRRLALRTAA